jgi:hypothetical protein
MEKKQNENLAMRELHGRSFFEGFNWKEQLFRGFGGTFGAN